MKIREIAEISCVKLKTEAESSTPMWRWPLVRFNFFEIRMLLRGTVEVWRLSISMRVVTEAEDS